MSTFQKPRFIFHFELFLFSVLLHASDESGFAYAPYLNYKFCLTSKLETAKCEKKKNHFVSVSVILLAKFYKKWLRASGKKVTFILYNKIFSI